MASVFKHTHPFTLESGITLPGFHLAYTTHGKLNEKKNNVVWIFHALTANSDASEWWPGLVGEGKFFDPAKYFIICVNMPGSCYGSLGPLDIDPVTQQPYYHDFPFFTTRDMIRAYQALKDYLGLKKFILALVGQWAVSNYWNGLLKNRPCLNTLFHCYQCLSFALGDCF